MIYLLITFINVLVFLQSLPPMSPSYHADRSRHVPPHNISFKLFQTLKCCNSTGEVSVNESHVTLVHYLSCYLIYHVGYNFLSILRYTGSILTMFMDLICSINGTLQSWGGHSNIVMYTFMDKKWLKLNSYSNASVFLSLCRMRISVFWGQERLTDRSISKRYLKSDIATWVEKSSTSRAIHARDTGFYWSSENALHERFIASSGVGVWMKMLQLIAKR